MEDQANTYLLHCHYYHGEESCPEIIKQLPAGEALWFYEKRWVEFNMETEDLNLYVDEYNAYGMSDFSTEDGVPISLKALLFNRFYRGGYVEVGGASFRKWYQETYLQACQ